MQKNLTLVYGTTFYITQMSKNHMDNFKIAVILIAVFSNMFE